MIRRSIVAAFFALCLVEHVQGQDLLRPDTIAVLSGKLILRGVLWRPHGPGPFPGLIWSHGNYASKSSPGTVDAWLGSVTSTNLLGHELAENGYVFLGLFRRGTGLSKGMGESSQDLLDQAQNDMGPDERDSLQVHLLETDQMEDIVSGVRYLRSVRGVDTSRLAVIGHSFGGSLALLLAERDPSLKAVIAFGAAAKAWGHSPRLRARLTESVTRIHVPVLLLYAKNDYSTAPGDSLGAWMDRLGRPHAVIIYPPFGENSDVGHNFIFLGITMWERDVLGFLGGSFKR
ncbi:MAG TPA: dienelactone hydrolase family protein [Bacteroidota bacterium]|nr:dienelactone hydrolase family protein [Bacteroidota bacterium]